MQDQNQDFGVLLDHEFFDEDAEDVCIDDRLNSESELSQINKAGVGIVSDLLDGVVEKLSRYFNELILYENDATHLRTGNLEHSTRGKFSYRGVLVAKASEKLL